MRKKFIAALAVSALLIPFATMMVLEDYYGLNRPESPQVDTGQTVPILIYEGHIKKAVYITSAEAKWLDITRVLTAIGAGIFVCYVIVRVVKAKRDSGDL